jgi:hypothetical protein
MYKENQPLKRLATLFDAYGIVILIRLVAMFSARH